MKRTSAACLLLCLSFNASFSQKDIFGTVAPELVNLKGSIYFLEPGTRAMPEDIGSRKVEAVVYTKSLDMPVRLFTEGLPGMTKRFEWFGIIYTGAFEITKPGLYKWCIGSDDGSKVWVDDKLIIDNDRLQVYTEDWGRTELPSGRHTIKVWFFQGPANQLALRLFVLPPGGSRKIFNFDDYSAGLAAAAKKLNAVPTKDGLKTVGKQYPV